MADCCAQLQVELAMLRAEVSRLGKVDEEAIIKKAVDRAKGEIVPLIDQIRSVLATIDSTLKVVKRTADTAEAIAKAADAAAKALSSLLKLVPYIPALIALIGIGALITGFAARIAAVESRVGTLETGLNSVFTIMNRISNSILRLQEQLNNLKLQKGDKGDAGYTPRKNIDYFDGRDGKDGYTPRKGTDYKDGAPGQSIKGDRGRDGKDGYAPRKNIDYFDGRNGKDGYTPKKGTDYRDGAPGQSIKGDRGSDGKSIKGDRGSDGKSIKGDRGVPGQSIKGDRGERGVPGQSVKGDKGDSEMPTDLSPVLNAIANLRNKVDRTNSELSNNKDRLNAIYDAVNIELAGIISSESCVGGIEPFPYSGLGLRGVQGQLNSVANQIAKVHEDVCNVSGGGSGATPEETGLLQKIYAILGGNIFYPNGTEAQPRFLTNAEVSTRSYASILFNEDGSEGSPAICNNILDAISISNAVNYYRMGLHEFPASLPESLISKDEGFLGNLIPNENKDIHNLTRYLTWYVERFDEVVGQWEIPIEIKDSDPSKPGEQPVGIKLPNIAEAIAEMFILCFQTNLNSETLLNMLMRTMGDSAADKQQNFISYKLLQSLTDYVGFKQKDIKLKMPLLFTLGKSKYDEILKESEVEVACVEFDDKFGLEADLMRFRESAAILAAVYKKKINPTGDIKAQVLKYLLDTLTATNKVNTDEEDDNFEQFIQDVETGFTNAPGMKDAVNPYGRPFTQRPKIRDLTKYVPPTNP